ncbi:MAG: hypothetical protein KGJ57_17530 [Sphingomonadales bacterium]|nr:hypothetical protein [Sphingomonadales bacterium]MDE2171200.1 hypothetical protein [Sphingomonadales bacterium]
MRQSQSPQMVEARLALLYQLLIERAREAALCPTSAEVAAHLHMSPQSNLGRYFSTLEERGLIRSDRYMRGRVVTIVETGERTAMLPNMGEPLYAAQPVSRKHDADYWNSSERIAQRQSQREHEAARISSLIPVDRTPCRVCGVRGDIGCKHRGHA